MNFFAYARQSAFAFVALDRGRIDGDDETGDAGGDQVPDPLRPQEASGLPLGIRISVGGEFENEILIETLEKILKAQPALVGS